MVFGQQISHMISGLTDGAYVGLQIDLKKPAIPICYNVIDAATIVNLLNVMLLPTPKLFIGLVTFNTTPVGDTKQIFFQDPALNNSFEYTDFGDVKQFNNTGYYIFTQIISSLTAKYSVNMFGYLFEYHF